MARKAKPVKPGRKRHKSMGGSSRKMTLTARQREALRILNQDFNW